MGNEERNTFYSKAVAFLRRGSPPWRVFTRCCDCEYYHPDWTYRMCYYVECPYRRRKYTIRRFPLLAEPVGLVTACKGGLA